MEAIWPIFDFSKIKQYEKVVYVSLFKQNTFNFGETNSAASLFIQSSWYPGITQKLLFIFILQTGISSLHTCQSEIATPLTLSLICIQMDEPDPP